VSRPALHHTVTTGWVNDPLGLTFHRHQHEGRYHLFFQYVPARTTWDVGCHWGHVTSPDLVHWTAEPVALSPGDGEDGIWSGCLVLDGDTPTIFYTAVDADDREIGRVRRAVALDEGWRTWAKQDVVVRLPEGETAVAFRDPFVYRSVDDDGWRMLLGGGLADGRPAVWIFTSPDLHAWEYAGRLDGTGDTGSVWECPMLLRLDGRSVLVVADGELGQGSHASYAWVDEEGDRLVPGAWRRLSYGAYYAASPFVDAEGRVGLVHWIRDVAGDGWAGAHSIPHLLAREGDRLVARPHPAVAEHTRRVGEVQVLVDGPVVEVFSPSGVLAVVLPDSV
jgi:beta-fructofuranosidase